MFVLFSFILFDESFWFRSRLIIEISKRIRNFALSRSVYFVHYIFEKRFCFILDSKIAKKQRRRISSQKTLMLVVYPLPGKGLSISDMAWERTVYFFNGVWRCLESDIQWTSSHAFFHQYLNAKEGTVAATVFLWIKHLFLW